MLSFRNLDILELQASASVDTGARLFHLSPHPVTGGDAQLSGKLRTQTKIRTEDSEFEASLAAALVVFAAGAIVLTLSVSASRRHWPRSAKASPKSSSVWLRRLLLEVIRFEEALGVVLPFLGIGFGQIGHAEALEDMEHIAAVLGIVQDNVETRAAIGLRVVVVVNENSSNRCSSRIRRARSAKTS